MEWDDDVTPLETPAWLLMSKQAPYFADLAENLSKQLWKLGHRAARAVSAEGILLAASLREWVSSPPTDQEREELMNAMISFNCRALSLLEGSRTDDPKPKKQP